MIKNPTRLCKRSNAVLENKNLGIWNEEEEKSLQRSDYVPITTVNKPNLFSHQVPELGSHHFKFKHPFGILVAGPTQSGKTLWTVNFLKECHQRIYPPVDGILFCYSEWQDKYDTLKSTDYSISQRDTRIGYTEISTKCNFSDRRLDGRSYQ